VVGEREPEGVVEPVVGRDLVEVRQTLMEGVADAALGGKVLDEQAALLDLLGQLGGAVLCMLVLSTRSRHPPSARGGAGAT
jgi:hypothetical protein